MPLAVLALALHWLLGIPGDRPQQRGRALSAVLVVLPVVVAVGTLVQVVLIGHSGARAAWSDTGSSSASSSTGR